MSQRAAFRRLLGPAVWPLSFFRAPLHPTYIRLTSHKGKPSSINIRRLPCIALRSHFDHHTSIITLRSSHFDHHTCITSHEETRRGLASYISYPPAAPIRGSLTTSPPSEGDVAKVRRSPERKRPAGGAVGERPLRQFLPRASESRSPCMPRHL